MDSSVAAVSQMYFNSATTKSGATNSRLKARCKKLFSNALCCSVRCIRNSRNTTVFALFITMHNGSASYIAVKASLLALRSAEILSVCVANATVTFRRNTIASLLAAVDETRAALSCCM